MTRKFAFLIVAAMGLAAPAYAQSVRVITGDVEHIYGPGGQILDDDALTARNERAEKAKILRLREREDAVQRRQELDAAAARAAAATDDEPYYAGPGYAGSDYVGTFRGRHTRHINLRRMSAAGAVSGHSVQFRHANARVRR